MSHHGHGHGHSHGGQCSHSHNHSHGNGNPHTAVVYGHGGEVMSPYLISIESSENTQKLKKADNVTSIVDPETEEELRNFENETTIYAPSFHFTPKGPLNNIHDALTNMTVSAIEDVLKSDPQCVNQRGWSGMYPLHRAVMRKDYDIISLVLKCGADPNCRNDFGETPFHWACKHGNPRLMKLLIDNGSDVSALDRMGRNAMHHAAQGGSVVPLHYLWEVHGLTFSIADSNLNTPLHLTCSQGHLEVLRYLLKKDYRGDIGKRDIYGNNSLHIAAKYGYGESCWRLLNAGGIGLLRTVNREGKTPLDLAAQGKEFKHKKIVSLLSYYVEQNNLPDDHRPEGPVMAWYGMLVFPAAYYLILLLLCYSLPFPGTVMTLGSIGYWLWYQRQGHRLSHFAGWPNPVQVGTFASGVILTFSCYFFTIVPVIYTNHPVFVWITAVLTPVYLLLYFKIIRKDAGSINEPARKDNGSMYTVSDIASGLVQPTAFCQRCEMIPPKNIKHCKLCDKCFYEMDHHCLFIYNCVAFRNHRNFILLLMCILLAVFMYFYSVFVYLPILHKDITFSFHWIGQVCSLHPWLSCAAIVNFMCAFWSAMLLKLSLQVISMGYTALTLPDMRLTKQVFPLSTRLHNLKLFFLNRRAPPSGGNVKFNA